MTANLENLCWPVARLGEALAVLARESGLVKRAEGTVPSAPASDHADLLTTWFDAAADALGLEAEPVESSYAEADGLVRNAAPALLQLGHGTAARFLAVLRGGARSLSVLGPDLLMHRVPCEVVRDALCGAIEGPHVADAEKLLEQAGVAASRRPAALRAILRQQLGGQRVGSCWLLRLPPGAGLWRQARAAGVPWRLLGLLTAHAAQYGLWLLSWWMIGQAALQGRFDWGWLTAWALLLFALIPFRLLETWWQGLLAIRVGALLKRRLLFGALRLQPEEIRHQGAGQLLGCVLESEAVESLALSGGFLALMAGLELVLSAAVLTQGPGGGVQVLLLTAWLAITLLIAWRYFRTRDWWTESRLKVTNDLVERMMGHRTRLAQESRERWHDGEDQSVSGLQALGLGMDRFAARLTALAPRGWLVIGLAGLTPWFAMSNLPASKLAVGLGGVLLAFRALQRFAGGLSHLAGAAISWKQIAPLYGAAGRPAERGSSAAWLTPSPPPAATVREHGGSDGGEEASLETSTALSVQRPPHPGPLPLRGGEGDRTASEGDVQPLLEAYDLSFRYSDRGQPVLRDCNLNIQQGDRIILEGPSGGGKSTFASLLAGLRVPESGMLLLRGLDRQTIGLADWRRRVAAAPQFHENHVLTGTFAFNLLMGCRWPPRQEDMDRAETICRELGLQEVLQRMPAGLLQLVGESGWQLSHGERSRLYIARALLQNAELVVLDEGFAALDPENLRRALRCVLGRARSLLVIAHP